MKTLLAFFGLIVLLILAVLTGGLGLFVILCGNEKMREALSVAIKEIIEKALYGKEPIK
jgi:hypothetical protein